MNTLREAVSILQQLGYRERQGEEPVGDTEIKFPGCTMIVNQTNKTYLVTWVHSLTDQGIRWFFEHIGFVEVDEDKYDYCPRLDLGEYTVMVHPYAHCFKIVKTLEKK